MANWANRTVVGLFFSGSGCMRELTSVGRQEPCSCPAAPQGCFRWAGATRCSKGDLLPDCAEGRRCFPDVLVNSKLYPSGDTHRVKPKR